MTYSDYEKGLDIIYDIVFGDCVAGSLEDKYNITRKLSLLDLNEVECNHLYEYIDQKNTEFNMIFAACRNACKKSGRR